MSDRRRLCPDAGLEVQITCLLAQVRHAVAAGVDVVQIRERDLEGRQLAALVGGAVDEARGSGTRIVVNDRLDVALAAGAHGVHLRGDSFPPAAVRPVVPRGFLIGQSVRSVDAAVRAAPDVDYLIAGAVWSTPSKPGLTHGVGEDGLHAIAHAVTCPVVAIGGVDVARLARVAAAGAAGAASIGLFIRERADRGEPGEAPASACGAVPLSRIVERGRAMFGTSR